VFGSNVILPAGLEGDLPASRRISRVQHMQLARRSRRRLGERLTLIEPIPHEDVRGFTFSDLFLDRRGWPDLMRRGHAATREALAPFRRRR
jgi:hypothetical protein